MLMELCRDLTSFIYPPRCVCCRSAIVDDHDCFCQQCQSSLSLLATTPMCACCAAPLPRGSACPRCRGAGVYPFARIVALGPFREPLRGIIHSMKYHHRRWPLAEIFADQMLAQDRIGELLRETDVLVPIPLHWSRQIWRGYNQADSLARRLASRRPHLRLAHPLVRLKNTVAQTTAGSIAARAKNLRFAFGLIDPRLVAGKRITLVDDVSTTASTLKAAACEIKSASPAAINALVIAVADPKRRDFQTV